MKSCYWLGEREARKEAFIAGDNQPSLNNLKVIFGLWTLLQNSKSLYVKLLAELYLWQITSLNEES